jgi:hypothetical protein
VPAYNRLSISSSDNRSREGETAFLDLKKATALVNVVMLSTMYFPCFSSAGSYLQCIFPVSAQREAICNVFSLFQLSGKLSAMFFPVSAQREAFLQCIFLVLT